MNQIYETLQKLYNTLLLIHTSGEDTVYMSDCLLTCSNLLKFCNANLEKTDKEEKINE